MTLMNDDWWHNGKSVLPAWDLQSTKMPRTRKLTKSNVGPSHAKFRNDQIRFVLSPFTPKSNHSFYFIPQNGLFMYYGPEIGRKVQVWQWIVLDRRIHLHYVIYLLTRQAVRKYPLTCGLDSLICPWCQRKTEDQPRTEKSKPTWYKQIKSATYLAKTNTYACTFKQYLQPKPNELRIRNQARGG